MLRHLGDIHSNPPRLVLREHLGRHPPLRFILIIDVSELLPVAVLHNEGSAIISTVQGGGKRRLGAWRMIVRGARALSHIVSSIVTQHNRESFLTLRIASPLHQQLRATAERNHQSVSAVARRALVTAMATEIIKNTHDDEPTGA
jgi:hypothetical protein